jgi:RNA polymerase sigma-70 factor (ECF subfamily)
VILQTVYSLCITTLAHRFYHCGMSMICARQESGLQISPELRALGSGCPESLSDEELFGLLSAAAFEDQAATDPDRTPLFDELYRRYQGRVLRWCYRVVRDHCAAADLAQEVFLKAYRRIGSYRGESRVSTWMFSVTRNHCLTALKRRNADPLEGSAPFPPALSDSAAASPDSAIEILQLSALLRGVITRFLDPLEARILLLHYGHGLPLATLTARFALSNPSGAKAYIVNGRRKLKRALEGDDTLAASLRHARVA